MGAILVRESVNIKDDILWENVLWKKTNTIHRKEGIEKELILTNMFTLLLNYIVTAPFYGLMYEF